MNWLLPVLVGGLAVLLVGGGLAVWVVQRERARDQARLAEQAQAEEARAAAEAGPVLSGEQVARRLLKSAVYILPADPDHGPAGFGTGTLVHKSRRLVVTTYAVVGEEARVAVFFPAYEPSGELITAPARYAQKADILRIWGTVLARDAHADLAVIELDRVPEGVLGLPLAPHPAPTGATVYSLGGAGVNRRNFSGALWQMATLSVRGRFNGSIHAGDGRTVEAMFLETQPPAERGDSGGPIVNDRAELVGVVSTADPKKETTGRNIDVSDVRTFLAGVATARGWSWEAPASAPPVVADEPPPGPPTLADLIARARAGDADARVEAIRQLGAIGPDARPTVPALVEALDDPDERIRRMAAVALDQIGPPAPEDRGCLEKALVGSGKYGKLYALRYYATAERVTREQLPLVVALFDGPDAEVREAAIRAVGFYGPTAKPVAFAKLLDRVADEDPAVAAVAGTVLTAFAPYDAGDQQVLVDHLTSREWHLRALSVHVLGPLARDETTALAWFEPRLVDDAPQVRGAAARALARWGPAVKRVLPALITLTRDDNPKVRTAAVRTIGEIGGGPGAVAAVAAMLDLGTPASVRGAAAAALAKIDATDPVADLPVLAGLLKSGDPVTTPTILAKLAAFGPAAKIALPDVAALLRNPDPTVRFWALRVIARVGPDAADLAPRVYDVLVRRLSSGPPVGGLPPQPVPAPAPPLPGPPVALTREQVADQLTAAAVWVVAERFGRPAGAGCGTLIDGPGRLVLTTAQVATSGDTFTLFFPVHEGGGVETHPAFYLSNVPRLQRDGYATTGRVVLTDPRVGLAVIHLDTPPPAGAVALPLAAESAQPGQALHEVGSVGVLYAARPTGALWRYTPGRVRGVAEHPLAPDGVARGTCRALETDLPIGRWDGGSAVANDRGELVGVNVAADPTRRAVGLAVGLDAVQATVVAATRSLGLPIPVFGAPPASTPPPPPAGPVPDPVPTVAVDETQVLGQAVSALAHLGPTATELVAKTLDMPLPLDAHERAFRALGKLGPAAPVTVIPYLLLAADRHAHLRPAASEALAQIGGDDVSKRLRERTVWYLQTTPRGKVRHSEFTVEVERWAIHTTGKLDPKRLSDQERLNVRESLLELKQKDPNEPCRREAETALSRLTAAGLLTPGK